jgi:hypothetical protein
VSDLARQYPPALQPGLVSGTAASNSAGAGVTQPAGSERASAVNQHSGHDYKDDRTK